MAGVEFWVCGGGCFEGVTTGFVGKGVFIGGGIHSMAMKSTTSIGRRVGRKVDRRHGFT